MTPENERAPTDAWEAVRAEVERLSLELSGERKAKELALAWMASVTELYDAQKHEVRALRERVKALEADLKLWKPLTPEEAEKAMAEAEVAPLPPERIAEIVKRATDPAERITNDEQAQLVARIRALEALANRVANDLVPVAGELMRRACGDSFEHEEGCACNTCRAFLATQKATTDLAALLSEAAPS